MLPPGARQVRGVEGRTGRRSPREVAAELGLAGGSGRRRGGPGLVPALPGPGRALPLAPWQPFCALRGVWRRRRRGEGLCHLGLSGRNSPGRSTQARVPAFGSGRVPGSQTHPGGTPPRPAGSGGPPPPPGLNSGPGHRRVRLVAGPPGSPSRGLPRALGPVPPRVYPQARCCGEGRPGSLPTPQAPAPRRPPPACFENSGGWDSPALLFCFL